MKSSVGWFTSSSSVRPPPSLAHPPSRSRHSQTFTSHSHCHCHSTSCTCLRTADENHTIPIVSPSTRPIFRPLDRTFWSRFANVMRKPLHPPAPRKCAVFSASRNDSIAGTSCVDLHHIIPPCGSHHSTHPRIFECFACLNHRIWYGNGNGTGHHVSWWLWWIVVTVPCAIRCSIVR